ncbi:stAR-related lipid transfer protein 9-like [Salvelinus alpinus]|uniref:stAR-related lipid transfer protein 9-like n=1 Tax=Salvelinus alpinus TaxID=8036 RepID=UPI0039FD7348
MANVKVAIRVRPLNARESVAGGRLAVQVEDKLVRIKNSRLDGRQDGPGESREKVLEFGFDYCYWSVAPEEPHYASQEEVFQDLGVTVLAGASEGYNVCLFAYGQTGTGKTYTMMGTLDSMGLTPRICQGLFKSDDTFPEGHNSSRVEISFLEIYNERVRDLLRGREQKKKPSLRVREHPEKGPYVQDLSQHVVSDYKQAVDLLEEGIANRITAATHNHDASSRSHAIFTIQYTQAILENNLPSEIVSKINLVDLAGSERADPHYCRDRLTEGSNINKSLVTLGIVISALAQNSQMSSSCQSINSVASEGEGSSLSGGGGGGGRRHCFIPYRDSVLTWLLKDSLGGNAKTIMIATVSPSSSSYNETLSTLRYASHARNIVNKPRVNEDASVRLIRELREEIDRLKSMLLSFEMQRNPSPSLSDQRDGSLSDIVLQNELKVDELTKDWSESWRDKKELLEQYSVDINRDRGGFLIHSLLPHLITLDRDVLSTGVTIYHLREGVTRIGPQDKLVESQIVLQGGTTCEIENQSGVVTLRPLPGTVCMIKDREVTEPCRLAQGTLITLGGVHKFRFNHPAEAEVMRERRRASEGAQNCNYNDFQALTSDSRVGGEAVQGQTGDHEAEGKEPPPRQQCVEDQLRCVEEQRGYVECLRQEIQTEQRQAERDLEREQAHLRQRHTDIQQWILQEKQRLAAITLEERGTQEFSVQTDPLQTDPIQADPLQTDPIQTDPLPADPIPADLIPADPIPTDHIPTDPIPTDPIPAPILDSLLTEDSEGSDEECDQRVAPPSKVVLYRKKVVQDELLRHHALRRAESHVRRKRLQYQLERIARKRHLLEAKRELQRLEKALPPGLESPVSPGLGSPSRSRGRQPVLRRHSVSSDLLSRLYPQHTPIFSHFLKRNKPSELTFGSIGSRQWVSDECLPRERTRSRSNTFSSGTRHSSQVHGYRSRASSSENLKPPVKEEALVQPPCHERPERKPLLPFTFKNNQNPSQSPDGVTLQSSSNVIIKGPTVTVSKSSSLTQRAPCQGVKSLPRGSSKGVETIRKVLSRSVGPGIKTPLARVFRKPPSGLSIGGRGTKPSGKTASRFDWKQKRGVEGVKMSRKKCTMKTTVSCEDLDQKTPSHDCGWRQKRWHSAETLMNQTSTLRWVERPQGLGLAGSEKYDGEEEEKGEEERDQSSDGDSLFSVDSLSSVYATALAEQLKQEEAIQSEGESEDSQMSKDSLAMESRGKHIAARPAQRRTVVVPSHSAVRGFLNPSIGKTINMASEIQPTEEGREDIGKSNEMPAEAYWSHHGGPKTRVNKATGATRESLYQNQPATEPRCRDPVSKLSEELGHVHTMLTSSPCSLSSCSVGEPESLLVLTDTWSYTDAADSPRILRDSAVLRRRMVFSHGALDSNSSPSPISVDLSDCRCGFGSTGSHSSASTDSTEGEHVPVEEQRLGVSTDSLNFPDSQLLQMSPLHLMMPLNHEAVCCKGYFERQLVSSGGLLKGSIHDPGLHQNQSTHVSAELPSHRSACAPTIDYKIQCTPSTSTLEADIFHGPQMQQVTLSPEVMFVGVADLTNYTDTSLSTYSHQSKASLLTSPKTEGEMLNETPAIESAPNNYSGDNELCNLDGDMEEVREEEFCKASNTKDLSLESEFKILQKLEAKVTEQDCVLPEQACVLPEQDCVLLEKDCVLPEQACVLPEQGCVLSEQACVLSEQDCVLSEQACVLSEQACVLPEQGCVLSEQACVLSEQDCVLSEQACVLPEQDCVMSEQACVLPEQDCVLSEQDCVLSEHEFFKVSFIKKNKGLQDSFIGSLKIPKRSNGGDFVAFSTVTVKNSQEVISPDDNNNTSELKDKQTSSAVDSFKLNLSCNECHFQQDTSALAAMSVSVHISHENLSPCGHKTIDTGGHKESPFGEKAVIEKRREVEQVEEREVQGRGEKLNSESKRREVENVRWGHHHGDSNCSTSDHRISEVMKEDMRMSFIDGGGDNSNSELDSQSSQILNALPTSNPNKSDSPKGLQAVEDHQIADDPLVIIKPGSCSISEKSCIGSEILKMDNTTDMANVSHGKVLRLSTSIKCNSMNQLSLISKENDPDSRTKISSESQLSKSFQENVREVQLKNGITDVDASQGQDASGCSVTTPNASVNSGAASYAVKIHEIQLSLALNNRGKPEYINKPVLLPMGCSSMSTSTSTAPKEFLLSQGKVFERDVPFSHMENIKKQTGPEIYHPHHACLSNNDKQTVNQAASPEQNLKSSALQPLQNCPGTVSSVTTPPNMAFAHARDLIMDSEYEVQGESKNQCKLTSTGASGQLYLNDCHRHATVDSLFEKNGTQCTPENIEKHHNSQPLSNNLCESQKLQEKGRNHIEVRKELQKDPPYATNLSQELPQSKCSSETQVDKFHKTCVTVDPDPKDKLPSVKHKTCHVEKWLKAQCNVSNFASDNTKDCQMAKNEEGAMTDGPLAKCPGTLFDVPSKINSIGSSPSQITHGSSDDNVKILGDICRDIMSREGNTKTSNRRQSHRFCGSSVVHCKKGKSKRFRRSKAQAPPSSSSDSTLKSSSDEEEKIPPRLDQNRSSSTRMKSGTQTNGKIEEMIQCNGGEVSLVKRQSPQSKDNHTMEACTDQTPYKYDGKAGVGISLGQKEHSPNGQSPHIEKRTNREKIMSSIKETEMSHYTPKTQDSPMHFASSDINPFAHQWQEEEPNQSCYKNQVFGSAADISCKSPLLDSTTKRIIRCCSVDNGLNVQNSPFNSHLSTYANNKGLSSTLSSMEEDFKDQTSLNAHLKERTNQVSGADDHNQQMTLTMSCNSSSCYNVSGDLGNSTGQVDEIMLVYDSSERAFQGNGFQRSKTNTRCDQSTQTTFTQETTSQTTINHGDLQRRNNRHRKSSTQVPVSQKTTEACRETTTWDSLQNMSEHLSQLIVNTSDLLGNVQGMRSGDSLKHSLIRNVKSSSHLYSSIDWRKRDCSTKTAVDIGIQTERTLTPVQDKLSIHQSLSTERSKAHEVNVIVKVIGSEVLNVSQDKGLPLQHQLKKDLDDNIQSMPDLRLNGSTVNQRFILEPESLPHKVPSLETVQRHNHSNPAIRHRSNEDRNPERVSSSKILGVSEVCHNLSEILRPESHTILRRSDPGIGYRKQVSFTDRACSPILTVGPRAGSNQSRIKYLQSLKEEQKFEMQNRSKDHLSDQSTPCLSYSGHKTCMCFIKNDTISGHDSLHLCEKPGDNSTTKSMGLIFLENVSALSHSSPKGSDGCSESLSSSIDNYIHNGTSVVIHDEEREMSVWHKTGQRPIWSLPSVLSSNRVTMQNHTSLAFSQTGESKQEEKSFSTFGDQLSYRRHSIDSHNSRSSERPVEHVTGVYEHSPVSDSTMHVQEDDMAALAPSECNTDILVNTNPVTHTPNFQHSPHQLDHQRLPEDLPVHNKFTNWSGISQHPSEIGRTNSLMKPAVYLPTGHEAQRNQPEWAELESQESKSSLSPESMFHKDKKTREIERLRKEREQVIATVQLNMNPHHLTVELTEAKLHYGLGETDTLLKMLTSGGTKEEEPSPVPTKQQLYDQHRRSIESLRKDREAQLQTCRRAHSLSLSKHHFTRYPPQPRSPPQKDSRVSALPSRCRGYLQQLRQEVVASRMIPDPPRGEGEYLPEIEHLLRDYGRAREEAMTEISRARERLRERTEQEKRRLQQQTLSQMVKDDLRYRTRVSSSTLYTGSSLSLSSGPTSGYNSGNTAQLKDGSRPSLTQEVTEVLGDGLKVRSRPPICGSQSVKTQRAWPSVPACLAQRAWPSAQDVRLEPGVSGYDPLMSSSPSSPTNLRQRTASFGSASSISTAYQDFTSCLLGRAMAEVRLAAAGDMGNLVMGKAAAGWRYQGVERGVQAFYKPSSSPSVHCFLGAVELERPLASLWSMVRDHSKTHLYHEAVQSAWTRPLDDSTQLVYLLTDPSSCHLKQPRDFCCISTQSQQDELCVLAMQSVFEESLPRPSVEAVRGEMLPSAWVLQPITRHVREVVRVIYLLQVDLGTPSLPQRLLGSVARRQASVLAELDTLFSL